MTFIPHGATCEADHINGSDFGKCGEPARRTVVDDKDRVRYVCSYHWLHWVPKSAATTAPSKVEG